MNEIEVGKHGIYIKRMVFRPSLAPGCNGLDGTPDLFEHTCQKAAPLNAWKEKNIEISYFLCRYLLN
jgi:AMMECR1 domain-containing protein